MGFSEIPVFGQKVTLKPLLFRENMGVSEIPVFGPKVRLKPLVFAKIWDFQKSLFLAKK